jgi:hypothetical protein
LVCFFVKVGSAVERADKAMRRRVRANIVALLKIDWLC